MTTLLGSKYRITTLLAAGALVALSGCTASTADDGGTAASSSMTSSSTGTAAAVPSASARDTAVPPAQPSVSASASPSASATTAAAEPAPSPATTTAPPAEQPAPPASAPTAPTAPSAPPATAPTAPGTCTAAQLDGAVESQLGGGAAGSVYRTLRLTNVSQAGCTMAGYPGVSFVDAAGNQLGAPADRADAAVAPVTLAPGTSVSATLQQTNAQNYGADCGLTQASGVRVYPPGATDSLILPQDIPACSASSIVLMTVGALQPVG